MVNALIKFINLSNDEKSLFFEAVRLAIWARIFTLLQPFRKFAKYLGTAHKESSFNSDPNEDIVYKIFRAMRRSSLYLPFNKKCLIEAVVVKIMLERRRIQSTLYLGVARNDKRNLIAHAWLRYGKSIIVGRKGIEKYVPVEWYS